MPVETRTNYAWEVGGLEGDLERSKQIREDPQVVGGGAIPIDDLESLLMGIRVPLDLPLETLP